MSYLDEHAEFVGRALGWMSKARLLSVALKCNQWIVTGNAPGGPDSCLIADLARLCIHGELRRQGMDIFGVVDSENFIDRMALMDRCGICGRMNESCACVGGLLGCDE